MIDDGVEISIQDRFAIAGPRHHPMSMEDHFLIQRCSLVDTVFLFYTINKFRKLHYNLEYPSVKALEMLLQGAGGPESDTATVKYLEKF